MYPGRKPRKQVFSWRRSNQRHKQKFWASLLWKSAKNLQQQWATTRQNHQNDLCAQRRQISLGIRPVWSESSLFTDAQADLSLRWAHRSFCWFCRAAVQEAIDRVMTNLKISTTGRGSSIGSEFAWHASGPEFDPHVRHILSWRLGHENISTAILPLPLIQEEQLSVTGERMCTKY